MSVKRNPAKSTHCHTPAFHVPIKDQNFIGEEIALAGSFQFTISYADMTYYVTQGLRL